MSEANDSDGKKSLTLSRPRRLELKKTVETGQVRQSFSHGRSKAVTVEVRKKRTFTRKGGEFAESQTPLPEEAKAPPAPEPVAEQTAETDESKARVVLRSLTGDEKAARARALADSKKAAAQARVRAEEEAKRRAEQEAQRKIEEAEAAKRAAEEEDRKRAEDEARRKSEETTARHLEEEVETKAVPETAEKPAAEAPKGKARLEQEEEAEREARSKAKKTGRQVEKPRPATSRRESPRRRGGKLTIDQALADEDRQRSLASVRRAREREKRAMREAAHQPPSKVVRDVVLPESITVQELANRMAERGVDVIKELMKMGVMASIQQVIDADTAELVVEEFGHRVKRVTEADVELDLLDTAADEPSQMEPRAPVVTVMGHVDHGKTSLLDALRQTDVAGGEAGGITQHIGAYQVRTPSGQKITFIDTPGHAAFSSMRARGAKVTDIVVLVVAADDGIMPQTVEAISHAKAAEVPIIVAINKMDKPEADPNRVRNELLQHEIVVEDMGGEVLDVEVSAVKKTGLAKLEEAIVLQSEILELKANPNRTAEGTIVEAKLERGRGSVGTVLVTRGTLRQGDVFVAGAEWGRVRALIDDHGRQIEEAGPAMPVEVLGFQGTPEAGDDFSVVESESQAREVSEFRQRRIRQSRTALTGRGSIEQMFSQIQAGEASELPVVIKSDVQGSTEAIIGAADKLGTDEVSVRVLHGGVGGINESDITLARASNALVIGFNVRANKQAKELAEQEGVDIRYYSVIYDVIDALKGMLSGMLKPEIKETFIGNAEIREVFSVSKVGKVAGCLVTDGVVRRGAGVRLLRDDVVIHEGKLATLKRFKDDVKEVRQGTECGMSFENYHDIQVGDVIEAFEVEEVAREL
jgi:translation initiation factor IF-2